MSLYALPPLLSALAFLGMGLVALRARRSASHAAFAAVCFLTVWWQLTWTVLFSTQDPRLAGLLVKIGYTGIIFIPIVYYHFSMLFLDRTDAERWRIGAAYAFGALCVALTWTTPFYIDGFRKFAWGYYPKADVFHPVYLAVLTYLSWRMVKLLLVELKRVQPTAQRHHQIRYALIAFVFYFQATWDFAVNYGAPWYPFGVVFILISLAIYAYAIAKHCLLDVRVAITRTGLLLATYFVVLGVPFALSWWGTEWLGRVLGARWWMVPLGLSTVLATIGPFAYGRLRYQTEQVLLRELAKTQAEAMQDALTHVLVRRAFLERAAELLREGGPCSVLMVDLDHFKEKNDMYGHLVGDVVLAEVARRLQQALRAGDLIGRYGGEEFILLLPKAEKAQAAVIAERLRVAVAVHPINTSNVVMTQTLSIGLAASPEDGATLEALTAAADQALYAAKHEGRDRVMLASAGPSPAPTERPRDGTAL